MFKAYNGDIICLQDVDKLFFHRELCPVLKEYHMDGLYFKKKGRRNEGLGCFYSTDKFEYVIQYYLYLLNNILTLLNLFQFIRTI